MSLSPRSAKLWVVSILTLHVVLALQAAWRMSPVWDEIVYPAAGFDLLRTGKVRLSQDHPPLGKVLMALPMVPWSARLKPAPAHIQSDPYRFGFEFTYQNTLSPKLLTFLPRLAGIMESVALGLLVYAGAAAAWGYSGGLLALILYAFSPAVLARSSLGLLEMPLTLFMTDSLWSFIQWRKRRRRVYLLGWFLFLLAAFLTKATAWVLIPVFLLSDLVPDATEEKKAHRWVETVLVVLGALAASELFMRLLGVSYVGTQLQLRTKDLAVSRFPFYFHGALWESAPWYFGLTAWLIKTPLALSLLAVTGFVVWARSGTSRRAFIPIACLVAVTGAIMISVRSLIASTHYFFLYPCLAWLGAAVTSIPNRWFQRAVAGLTASLVAGCLWVHPHHLAYFNGLVGGSAQGYRWLADSDQDWGQGLGSLAAWMQREQKSQILLAYSGAADPRTYGIRYQDVLSPALVTGYYQGEIFPSWPEGVWLAVGTKVAQSEPRFFGWLLKNRRPHAQAGYTFLIYDLSSDAEGLEWLSAVYRSTGRPGHAEALPRP